MFSEEKIFYVYGHYDNSGTLKYIGKGSKNRAWGFRQRHPRWKDFFSKNPPIVKLLAENLSEKDALDREIFEIADARKLGVELLNFGDGGEAGARFWAGKKRSEIDPLTMEKLQAAGHTPDALAKRAEKMRGFVWDPETIKKRAGSLRGRQQTEAHRAAISAGKTGKPNGLSGRVMPLEHREAISAATQGRRALTLDEQAKRLATWRANGMTTKKARAVECIETGIIYRCAKDAALAVSGSGKHIQACCTGRRAKHMKMSWRYV